MHLAADIGGTKANLALVDAGDVRTVIHEASFSSRDFADCDSLVRKFLATTKLQPTTACLAVPGPVIDGKAILTNLDWVCDESALAKTFGFTRVRLVNDLVGTAMGVNVLSSEDLVTLHPGNVNGAPKRGQLRAVIAPGTGLGEAFSIFDGDRWLPHPAEGGHSAWGPRSEDEADLWSYVYKRDGFVSVESVCSGMGVATVWNWLCDRNRAAEGPAVTKRIHAATDPTKEIMSSLDASERCRLAVQIVADLLAGEAADIAVRLLPTAGIYLGGGLPPRMLPLLQQQRFLRRYLDHPDLGHIHEGIPVHVVMNPKAALIGAMSAA